MISYSKASEAERRAYMVGKAIHEAVIAEGRSEGVWAYLFHAADGRGWFEKYNPVTKERSRKFSPDLTRRMREHKDELHIYLGLRAGELELARKKHVVAAESWRDKAAARCAAIVDRATSETAAPILGSGPKPLTISL